MDWGADRILALRKHAGMTQAQVAQWLGVTIKQVKYLEHQRRNPSGPTRRLLSILAAELNFTDAPPFQVLGASAAKKSVSKQAAPSREVPPVNSSPPKDTPAVDMTVVEALKPINEKPLPLPESDQVSDGGAFVWQ
jgi:transcriptional regulator with XRE-family HTH domain